ncbi:MAG TPA: SRPBCC domain-containing protein [Bacteroidia bacterium]|jgi:uncharacterized protein YndB with AHSA1/START domain|nr:SRPBCC domain-containing protein [Bacteroidia bacterium]
MPDIKHQFVIKASPAKVYEAITQIEGLKSWWTAEVTGDERQGGTVRFGFGKEFFNKMKIISMKKDLRLAWQCSDGPPEWIGTRLSFDLETDKEKNTVVLFSHDGWKEQGSFYASCNYHWGLYLRSLKQYCETGKGTPHTP